jgi:hypothetical protein
MNFFEKMPSSLQAPKLIVKGVNAIVNLINMCVLIKSIDFEQRYPFSLSFVDIETMTSNN